jgi:hypothetical protein
MNDPLVRRFESLLKEAIQLIESTPRFATTGRRLRRLNVRYSPTLNDRGAASLLGVIRVGPEAVSDGPISLAGTLVHEEYHTRQNPFLKTASVWAGVATRTAPMARYEWPAYREQVAFLRDLASRDPLLAEAALAEAEAVCTSVYSYYGKPPFQL